MKRQTGVTGVPADPFKRNKGNDCGLFKHHMFWVNAKLKSLVLEDLDADEATYEEYEAQESSRRRDRIREIQRKYAEKQRRQDSPSEEEAWETEGVNDEEEVSVPGGVEADEDAPVRDESDSGSDSERVESGEAEADGDSGDGDRRSKKRVQDGDSDDSDDGSREAPS